MSMDKAHKILTEWHAASKQRHYELVSKATSTSDPRISCYVGQWDGSDHKSATIDHTKINSVEDIDLMLAEANELEERKHLQELIEKYGINNVIKED